MFTVRKLAKLASVCILLSAIMGCGKNETRQSPAAEIQVSQTDYNKNDEVGKSVYQTHTISDSDLDWTLNYLQEAKNSLVRARAMTILAQVHPMSDGQKAKIGPAIKPYLNSDDALEKSAAQKVARWL